MPNVLRLATVLFSMVLTVAVQAQDRPDPQSPPPPASNPNSDRPAPQDPPANNSVLNETPVSDETTVVVEPTEGDTEVIEIVLPDNSQVRRHRGDRRPVPEGEVKLGLKDVSVKELYEWIATQTGKAVMPINAQQIQSKKFTIIMDDFIPRKEALDMLFTYLRLNGVGIIERDDVILIGDLGTMTKEMGEIEVVNANESVMGRIDRGTLVIKIFQVEQANADNILNNIQEFVPDYGKYAVDGLSNQIMVLGDVGLCQQFEVIIEQLDQKWVNQRMHTFRLKWADAGEIADNVWELFQASGSTGGSASRPATGGNRNTQNRTAARRPTAGGSDDVDFRVTVNVQQNTLTVQAEPDVMEEIATLIVTEWDIPRPEGTSRLFFLKYTDPLKVQSLLEEVLGTGSSTTSGANRGAGGNSNQRGSATSGISGVYRIDAYEDKNALLVLARTVESFGFIESIIEDLDQPSSVGLPEIISLKYADAVELSEEINVLLAKAGARVNLPRPATGLTAEGFADSGEGGAGVEGPSGGEGGGGDLQFPWQTGGNADEQAPESALIGKVRVVPIIRQNALAIMSPPAYLDSMRDLIRGLDQPRRQVQIAATIVEIEIQDDLALGIKVGNGWSNEGPFIGGNADFTAVATGFLSNILGSGAATTDSTLNLGPYSVSVIVEALATLTNARIIQEPRVFTADNEEAVFFSGKEYPVASSQTDAASGGLNTLTNINYRNVGVFLNVRPRITEEGAVDLSVALELSDVGPDVLVGTSTSAEFNRKQVNSHVILLDGQTLVIGGLLREAEQITKYAIPFLSEIPLIGPIFTFTDQRLERKELIAFITPTVVHRPEDNYSNFNVEDLERLKSVARPLADQLNEAEQAINLDVYNRIQSHVDNNAPGKKEYQPRELQPQLPEGSLDDAPIQIDIDEFDPETLRYPGEPKPDEKGKKEDES
ncbi:MAG: secretin N-terminal domain-containing protein [Phycisphaerales bacterium]|nr:secretin N-terminal domain-containing protein [Phycisphaerales bacterium]